ncbi:hypothetical protein SD77_0786 [Bacillus badius]|uniref:Uncharacterized protein n=1 Tax=Bacillus badius TaxID=1455 RepID=A0ABR5ATW4_BACBA|nr:hypothetical protein SD78_3967 [Bacillus badius]KIL78185.1 hypothetical protein SD77_0786 [Bacillus badius]
MRGSAGFMRDPSQFMHGNDKNMHASLFLSGKSDVFAAAGRWSIMKWNSISKGGFCR